MSLKNYNKDLTKLLSFLFTKQLLCGSIINTFGGVMEREEMLNTIINSTYYKENPNLRIYIDDVKSS